MTSFITSEMKKLLDLEGAAVQGAREENVVTDLDQGVASLWASLRSKAQTTEESGGQKCWLC